MHNTTIPRPVTYSPRHGTSEEKSPVDHEHSIEVEEWTSPVDAELSNGWNTPAAPSLSFRYLRDPVGFVHLEGKLDSGTTAAGTLIYTFPVGYRPSGDILIPVLSNFGLAGAVLNITPAGLMTIGLRTPANNIYFDTIFEADRNTLDFLRS